MVLRAKRQSIGGAFSQLKSLSGITTMSSTWWNGNTAEGLNPTIACQGESNSTGPGLKVGKAPKENNQDASNLGGIRHRTLQREKQKVRGKEPENKVKKWIIAGFPGKEYKTLEYIDVVRSRADLALFREMRNLYEKRHNKWKRLLWLRDVHKIHLVKVRGL